MLRVLFGQQAIVRRHYQNLAAAKLIHQSYEIAQIQFQLNESM